MRKREGKEPKMHHCGQNCSEYFVDANFPSGARLTMAAAKTISSKPIGNWPNVTAAALKGRPIGAIPHN